MMSKFWAGFVMLLSISCSNFASASISIGFEDYSLGPISSSAVGPAQKGWSGGNVGGFVNSDAGDEQIVDTVFHTGSQSWHYARGYNSPGSGTPYSPVLGDSLSVGETFVGSLWFKAHTAGDNSLLAIETGNVAGDDRAEILAYIDNVAGGITVRSFADGPSFTGVPIASGLDATLWHELSYSMTYDGSENKVSISVDGASPVNFNGSLKGYRDSLLAPYSESNGLKFRSRHADGDLAFNGFYLDDISYSITAAEVPEPASLVAWSLLGLTLGGGSWWRRQKATA